LTSRKAKKENSGLIDYKKQEETEKRVSQYIQKNFSFVVSEVEDQEKRIELESKIISTISLCDECGPSSDWLGLFTPKEKIRKSGLWLVNGLFKEPLSDEDMRLIENLVSHAAGIKKFIE